MTHPNKCPHCQFDLDRGDVYEHFIADGIPPEKALEWAENHGWSKDNPVRFSAIVGVYDRYLDRTTHFICPNCRERIVHE